MSSWTGGGAGGGGSVDTAANYTWTGNHVFQADQTWTLSVANTNRLTWDLRNYSAVSDTRVPIINLLDRYVSGPSGLSPGNPRTYFDAIGGLNTISFVNISGSFSGTGTGFRILSPFETAIGTGPFQLMLGVRTDVSGAAVQIVSNGDTESYPFLCGINNGGGVPEANFAIDRDGSLYWGSISGVANIADSVQTYRTARPASMGGGGMDTRLYRDGGSLRTNAAIIGDEGLSLVEGITANTGLASFSLFGPTLTAPAATPGSNHGMYIRKQSTVGGIIANVVESEWAGASADANATQSQVIFTHTATGSTGNLTLAVNGGGLRARRQVRQRGSGTVALASNDSYNYTQDASTGTVTEYVGTNYEAPSIGSSAITTTYINQRFRSAAITGTITTSVHSYYEALGFGSNKFEVWMDGAASTYYRESGIRVWSDAAARLRLTATTAIMLDASQHGFFSTTPISKPTVTGSRGANAALASLCTQLAALGLITDSTS